MAGSSLASILIPIAETISLAMWLTLVFYAGRYAQRAKGDSAPRHQGLQPAVRAESPERSGHR